MPRLPGTFVLTNVQAGRRARSLRELVSTALRASQHVPAYGLHFQPATPSPPLSAKILENHLGHVCAGCFREDRLLSGMVAGTGRRHPSKKAESKGCKARSVLRVEAKPERAESGARRAQRADKLAKRACYRSAKLVGRSGTRPRSCIALMPRVRRSRSSLLSTSRPVSSLTRSRR